MPNQNKSIKHGAWGLLSCAEKVKVLRDIQYHYPAGHIEREKIDVQIKEILNEWRKQKQNVRSTDKK